MNYLNILLILSLIICIGSIILAFKSKDEYYDDLYLNEQCYNKVYNDCDYLRNTTEWLPCIKKNEKNC
jgi:hypothetical protein